MIAFPFVSLTGLSCAGLAKFWLWPDCNTLLLLGGLSSLLLVLSALLMPFFMAIWLWIDHKIHPLDPDDAYDSEPLRESPRSRRGSILQR